MKPSTNTPIDEAPTTTSSPKYAGFWIRLLASIIDMIIVALIAYILFGSEAVQVSNGQFNVQLTGWKVLIPILYTLIFWIRLSTTPGKMILGLIIVDKEGKKINRLKSILRYLGYMISTIVIFLGFIWIAFDKKKQGRHDKIASTYVIKKKK